jgi:hypothetical protein
MTKAAATAAPAVGLLPLLLPLLPLYRTFLMLARVEDATAAAVVRYFFFLMVCHVVAALRAHGVPYYI